MARLVVILVLAALASACEESRDSTRLAPIPRVERPPVLVDDQARKEPDIEDAIPVPICLCADFTLEKCFVDLTGFITGRTSLRTAKSRGVLQDSEYVAQGLDAVVQQLSASLSLDTESGAKSVQKITLTGTADGQPNTGVGDWSTIPCSKPLRLSGPLKDEELAYARACAVYEHLFRSIHYKYVDREFSDGKTAILQDALTGEHHDIPPGGHVGQRYRKVRIEVWREAKHCEHQ